MKYSDALIGWLKDSGYSHCYFVAGGNIMHLLHSAREAFVCVPVVHEVTAAIATEYHNATLHAGAAAAGTGKALALVTAGPGLTNCLTGVAGAWLESRELLVLGGQVKVADLAPPKVRQLGIQEVNGVGMAAPVCKRSICLKRALSAHELMPEVSESWKGRPGPVFLEIPLDVQAMQVPATWSHLPISLSFDTDPTLPTLHQHEVKDVAARVAAAERPALLIGGGVSRQQARALEHRLADLKIPVMTTWNGADRYTADNDNYTGRPNTWGQRSSNLILQQADLVVAIGTRLGLQQTGFNWHAFVPLGQVIQIDIDPAELEKQSPRIDLGIQADADMFLSALLDYPLGEHIEWLRFCQRVRTLLPLSEPCNKMPEGCYLNPYDMVADLSLLCEHNDHIVPCSSGGAFTVMMQGFQIHGNQTMLTNKGLASMGYGLAGAIGVALADPKNRTILVEGDGGFAQNLQELATVAVNSLNLKIFLFCNNGYASIRMTQRNYFKGAYLGCDTDSGLGFPDWGLLADAFGIPHAHLSLNWRDDAIFQSLWHSQSPAFFLVPLHPEQTYFPKITSRISASGGMESNPLHLMSPDVPIEAKSFVMRYLESSQGETSSG